MSIKEEVLKDKIMKILDNIEETNTIINNTILNIDDLQKNNKIEFEEKFKNILY